MKTVLCKANEYQPLRIGSSLVVDVEGAPVDSLFDTYSEFRDFFDRLRQMHADVLSFNLARGALSLVRLRRGSPLDPFLISDLTVTPWMPRYLSVAMESGANVTVLPGQGDNVTVRFRDDHGRLCSITKPADALCWPPLNSLDLRTELTPSWAPVAAKARRVETKAFSGSLRRLGHGLVKVGAWATGDVRTSAGVSANAAVTRLNAAARLSGPELQAILGAMLPPAMLDCTAAQFEALRPREIPASTVVAVDQSKETRATYQNRRLIARQGALPRFRDPDFAFERVSYLLAGPWTEGDTALIADLRTYELVIVRDDAIPATELAAPPGVGCLRWTTRSFE